jgi:outer membrane protein assembly factor BamB
VAVGASGVLTVSTELVIIQNGPRKITAFDTDCNTVWSRHAGSMACAPTIADAITLFAVTDPAEMTAVDTMTGAYLWAAPLASQPRTSIVCRDCTIYIGTDAGIETYSLLDGTTIEGWNISRGVPSADFALGNQHIAYVNTDSELVVISTETGYVIWKAKDATLASTPFFDRQTVFWQGNQGIMKQRIGFETVRKLEPWADTSWLGKMTGPMIVTDSRIFMGRAGWGLVCLGQGQ